MTSWVSAKSQCSSPVVICACHAQGARPLQATAQTALGGEDGDRLDLSWSLSNGPWSDTSTSGGRCKRSMGLPSIG